MQLILSYIESMGFLLKNRNLHQDVTAISTTFNLFKWWPFLLKFNMTLLDVFHQELHDKDGNI